MNILAYIFKPNLSLSDVLIVVFILKPMIEKYGIIIGILISFIPFMISMMFEQDVFGWRTSRNKY